MPVQAICSKVQFYAYEPFRERRLPLKCFLPRTAPAELARFATPEFVGLFYGFTVEPLILRETVDASAFGKLFGRFENTLLNQMGFYVRLVHDNGVMEATNAESTAQRKVQTSSGIGGSPMSCQSGSDHRPAA